MTPPPPFEALSFLLTNILPCALTREARLHLKGAKEVVG